MFLGNVVFIFGVANVSSSNESMIVYKEGLTLRSNGKYWLMLDLQPESGPMRWVTERQRLNEFSCMDADGPATAR